MDDILHSELMTEMIRTATEMYRHGWDERNSGNISILLDEDQLGNIAELPVIRTIPMNFTAKELSGRCFLVTGTGKYFKNVQYAPERDLGIIRVCENGSDAELLWGFSDGGSFTSELPAHLMGHISRLKADPENKVILHCHPANILTMTFVHSLDEREFTRTLWQMCTESMIIFPDGVGVLPWMLCGTDEIAAATAQKLTSSRIVVWAQHGIYACGRSLDETFGLIETAEKAAEIYMKIAHLPRLNTINDDQLRQIAKRFNVTPREEYLE